MEQPRPAADRTAHAATPYRLVTRAHFSAHAHRSTHVR